MDFLILILVGSFQRDTEGKDLLSPKLVKGPDRFLEIVQDMYKKDKNVKIILSGRRRQYLINNFKKYNIPTSTMKWLTLQY